MSFPIDWTTAPDDDPSNPFFPDVGGWTKVIASHPMSIVSTADDGFDFTRAGGPLIPWTNPSNAAANDGVSYASNVTTYDNTTELATFTECLYASQFTELGDIPAGATIKAVMVSINGVLYEMAASGFFPPGPSPLNLLPFALHVDSGWQYLGGDPGTGLDTIPTGQKFSDGTWDGTPVGVGTDEVNFTDPSNTYPAASGGLLPYLGASGITLTAAQVNDPNFGIGFIITGEGPE